MEKKFKTIGEVLHTDLQGVSIESVLDKQMLFTAFDTMRTRYGTATIITAQYVDAEDNPMGEPFYIVTHSDVLAKQADDLRPELPVVGTITQRGRYYSFA